MDPLIIYTCCFGGIVALLCLRNIAQYLFRQCRPKVMVFYLRHLILPPLVQSTRFMVRTSRLEVLCNLAYWGATIACNLVGVHDRSDVGSRAARLAVLHFIPLSMTMRLSLAADLVGIPLHVHTSLHRALGWMVAAQSILHMITVRLTAGNWDTDVNGLGRAVGVIISFSWKITKLILVWVDRHQSGLPTSACSRSEIHRRVALHTAPNRGDRLHRTAPRGCHRGDCLHLVSREVPSCIVPQHQLCQSSCNMEHARPNHFDAILAAALSAATESKSFQMVSGRTVRPIQGPSSSPS
jgi:hypothetical protein